MNKTGARRSQIAIMVAFAFSCVGLLLFLWSSFGGPVPLHARAYNVRAEFLQASQLAGYADVRISGVTVGKVRTIHRDGRLTRVTMELAPEYAPLPRDTRAALRTKTLLGETFVALSFGDRRGPWIPEGGAIPNRQTAPTVQVDQIFDAFDPRTRSAFQRFARSFATATRGRGAGTNAALGALGPTLSSSSALLGALDDRRTAIRSATRDAGQVFAAAGSDDGAVQELARGARDVFATTAAQSDPLERTLMALPRFLDETRATARAARRATRDAAPALQALRRVTPEVLPALAGLDRITPDLRRLFVSAGPLLDAARPGLPAVRQLLDEVPAAADQLSPTLADVAPALQYMNLYREDLATTFTAGAAAGTSRSLSTGNELRNMARVTAVLNGDILGGAGARLPANRASAYPLPGNMRDMDRGLASYSCANVDNPGGLASVLDASGVQPCRRQAPLAFGGTTSMFPRLLPATPSDREPGATRRVR